MFDALGELQEIAEEMFVRFYAASGTAAQERAKNMVLMQEIQRLEKENGRLRTELVDTEERYWTAHEEVDKLKKELDWTLGQLSSAVKERTELSNEKTKLETQIRQMVAKEAKERIATSAVPPRNDNVISAAVTCPKCGSMDTSCTPTLEERVCNVCGEVFEDGRYQSI